MQCKIRKINEKDLNDLNDIGRSVMEFQIGKKARFWSIEILRQWQKSKDDILLGAFSNKKLIGFILCAIHRPTKKATLENIWTDSVFRQRGVAGKLLASLMDRLRKKNVTYLVAYSKSGNNKAINFFQKNHFQKEEYVYWLGRKIK